MCFFYIILLFTGMSSIRAFKLQQKFILESEEKVDLNQVCYFPSLIAAR